MFAVFSWHAAAGGSSMKTSNYEFLEETFCLFKQNAVTCNESVDEINGWMVAWLNM